MGLTAAVRATRRARRPRAQPSKKVKTDLSIDPARLAKQCMAALDELMAVDISEPFNEKVDWKGLGLHDYPKVVKHPMDLGTIKVRAVTAAGGRGARRARAPRHTPRVETRLRAAHGI